MVIFLVFRQHRVESDLNLLQSVQTRLKDSLEKCQNDLAQHEEKERQLILKNKILNKKLKAEKEEVSTSFKMNVIMIVLFVLVTSDLLF